MNSHIYNVLQIQQIQSPIKNPTSRKKPRKDAPCKKSEMKQLSDVQVTHSSIKCSGSGKCFIKPTKERIMNCE